ncbi:MAG: helix-turn-helix domain-containing protein, partial [Bacteroidetes bacterium]|nr:helix-turn-helix domain-containing protein [Bacteroidota bacterium]
MPDIHSNEGDFLRKITRIIEENISNAQFGVSELARETGMSRSNLLRKVKGLTKISVSQFIRQVRLKHGLEMLRQKSYSVSEVSYMVGFGSTSYFVKCFREYYGYPPGEVGKRDAHEDEAKHNIQPDKNRVVSILGLFFILVIFAVLVLVKPWKTKQSEFDKSIAVLPFHNDSDDSSNIHIINGLMEAVLTNLQQIEDLKVVSRTSAEKYRNNPKIISEIAKELNVSFIVEGSGQKIGDKILLNIQLIEAGTDTHLWAKQYNREAKDIFALQSEVAKNIANEIQVIITPEEEERINKVGTQNLVAYDLFLKGLDLMYKGGKDNLEEAIKYYELAILEDNNFARANAGLAITYFFLDANQVEKRFSEQINSYADKALLLDPQLAQSLIAKALYYMNNNENELALPYLETALRYNPNSALIINILADYYTSIAPNTEKYLEYALKGIQLDIA